MGVLVAAEHVLGFDDHAVCLPDHVVGPSVAETKVDVPVAQGFLVDSALEPATCPGCRNHCARIAEVLFH